MKKALTIFLLFSSFGLLSQKKMMVHPYVGFYGSPIYHLFEKNSSLIYSQDACFEFGGLISNRFLLKKNSLDLRIGMNWNNKKYELKNTNSLNFISSYTEFTYLNIPVLLSFSFDKYRIVKPFLSSGYSFGFLKKEYRETTFQSGETSTGFGNDVINYKKPSYLIVSIGANIHFNSQLSICLEPFYKHCYNGLN